MFLTGLFCFAIGTLVGAFLFMKFSPEQKKARDIVKHLHEQQDEFKNYQLGVTQHFVDTSRLLKQLSDSYTALHNHLASDADNLCGQNTVTPIIQKIPEIDMSSNIHRSASSPNSIKPPLDYAPRTTPYDKGTLNEEYGLEKVHINESAENDSKEP
jgi:hypothetical protein